MGHEFQQRRHREIGRAHEDQAKGHVVNNPGEFSLLVMAGLVPAIHVFASARKKGVDARDKPGHDG
jgi:hypothetical protein